MQKVTQKSLVQRAAELLENGDVQAVLGYEKGLGEYDVTPAIFKSKKELEEKFVWNDFCGANLSKYLIEKTRKTEGKLLVFLKPCDAYSFNQLLSEHRFNREKVYVIGVSCDGMADINKIKEKTANEILSVSCDEEVIKAETLYDGQKEVLKKEVLLEKCKTCKSKKHVAYDELIGEQGEILESGRFDEVEMLEKMSPEDRFIFWQKELSKCIRCNACRDVCPACTCETCVFSNPDSGVENKAAADSFEEKMFHIIRAFHVAGRCTDCGECSRVCPQNIPLHLLNRKFIKDINAFYGKYQAGEEVGNVSPLTEYKQEDLEPGEVFDGRDINV